MHAYNGCWFLFTQLEAVAGFNDDRYGQKLVHNKSRKAEEKHWTCSPPTSTSSYLLSKSEKTKAMKAMKMKNACSCTWESVGHQIQIEPGHQN